MRQGVTPEHREPRPAAVDQRSPQSRLISALAWSLLMVSVLVGATGSASEVNRQTRRAEQLFGAEPDLGQPVIQKLTGDSGGFLDLVRRVIPPDQTVAVILPHAEQPSRPTLCDGRVDGRRRIMFSLAPRSVRCTAEDGWTLYIGTRPPVLPAGVRHFGHRTDLLIVDWSGARR